MRSLLMSFLVVGLVGCATNQADRVKGVYSESDYQIIKPHLDSYSEMMSKSIGMGAFDPMGLQRRDVATQGNLKTVYCNCVKKLGDKACDSTSSTGVNDKQAWARARAAKEVIKTYSGTMFSMQDVAQSEFCSL